MKKKDLLKRIEKLEQRVSDLETVKANKPIPWTTPSPWYIPPWTCDGENAPEVRMSINEEFHAEAENLPMGHPERTYDPRLPGDAAWLRAVEENL